MDEGLIGVLEFCLVVRMGCGARLAVRQDTRELVFWDSSEKYF